MLLKFVFGIVFLGIMPIPATAAENQMLTALKSMQRKYQTVHTLSARFEQKQVSAMDAPNSEGAKSSGNLFIERDPTRDELKFRWQTLEPNPSVAVSNGKKFWLFTPPFHQGEKGQVQVHRAAEIKSALLADLLLANHPLQKSFDLKPLADCAAAYTCIELHPKKPTGDLDRVELQIEKKTNLVYKVTLKNVVGNRTELELKNIQLNPKVQESVFDFVVPPNTEVVQ